MLRSAKLRLWGGRVAVFAIWLQLVLSAGHMHPEELFGTTARSAQAGQGIAARRDTAPAAPVSGAAEDSCAICAAMQLAATALPPSPVLLRAPMQAAGRAVPARDHALPASAPYRLFQSRAPPAV
jgi:hypothetical protein